MSDPSPIRSPCIRTCQLENEVCVGCGRTRGEIAAWSRMSDAERLVVMRRLKKA
jgi:uncharacterized protein